MAVAPEQRTPEVQAGPSRGQASVFKAPRVLVSAQSQETTPSEAQATVAPIISTAAGDEQQEGSDGHAGTVEEQGQSDHLEATEVVDAAQSLLNDVLVPSSNEFEQELESR